VLEAEDVLKVLKRDPEAPQDLKDKSLFLAGELLEFSGKVKKGQGPSLAREVLESGGAFEKFERIASKQGPLKKLEKAPYRHDVKSPQSGQISQIHNLKIAKVAKLAGAPQDARAGVYLHAKVGDKVKEGQEIFSIYAENEEELNFAIHYVNTNPDVVAISPNS
jgi:thymidine phosphorylase